MTKLLFSDIDGTLLRRDGTISPALAGKLREMGQAGHGMILCSGRPLDGILLVQSYLESLSIHFPYSYVIANNGALVYDCNEKKAVLEDRLPMELIPGAGTCKAVPCPSADLYRSRDRLRKRNTGAFTLSDACEDSCNLCTGLYKSIVQTSL